MFERDWARATAKEKFWSFMARENKGNKANKPDKLALEVGGRGTLQAGQAGGQAAWAGRLQLQARPDCRSQAAAAGSWSGCLLIACPAGPRPQEVHAVIKRHYGTLLGAFVYYASLGSGDPFHVSAVKQLPLGHPVAALRRHYGLASIAGSNHVACIATLPLILTSPTPPPPLPQMPLNAFTSFLEDCGVPDADSAAVKRSDCDTVFIVCNFQPDKKSADVAVNNENALMRFEFLEALVRLGGQPGPCGVGWLAAWLAGGEGPEPNLHSRHLKAVASTPDE
jgi:hypothetical protein